jgi:hypothetical protein
MCAKPHKKAEVDAGEGVGLWYVSFADMITLLLSFFVMMAGFSSYDNDSLDRIRNASPRMYASPLPGMLESGSNSVLDPLFSSAIQTFGAETADQGTFGVKAGASADPATFAFSQRKTISLPLDVVFQPNSSALSDTGQKCVELVARYLSASTYYVLLGTSGGDPNLSLSRQWRVATLLARRGVGMKNVALSAPQASRDAGGPQLVMTLLPSKDLP